MAVAITGTDSSLFNSGSASSGFNQTGATGTAAADRITVVVIYTLSLTEAAPVPTDMTINGIDATLAVQMADVDTGVLGQGIAIWWALNPTGTTAAILGSFNTGADEWALDVFSVTGADTTNPISTSDNTTASAAAVSVTSFVIPTGGGAIGAATVPNSAATGWAWTNLTEFGDRVPSGAHYRATSASSTSAGTATITATQSGGTTGTNKGIAVAGFKVPVAVNSSGMFLLF